MKRRGLHYDEEHAFLREEARRWLGERCPIQEVRRLAEDPRGDDPRVWQELAELGWLGLLVPEAHGGAGLGAVHLAVLSEECGRRLFPSPLLATQLAGLVLARAGSDAQREAWLPGICDGTVVAACAHLHPGLGEPAVVLEDGRIHGDVPHVWSAGSADLLLVPARTVSGTRFVCVGREQGRVVPEIGLDPSRRQGRVRLEGVSVTSDAILERDAEAVWEEVLPWMLTALSAEMAGGADALLVMTSEYAATRQQFGKAIGAFQGVKHPLANVLVGVEQLRSLVYGAATALERGAKDGALLAHMAKAQASDVYPFAASRAIQFHGGYGFTDDCDAHLYLRRAQCSRPAFGDAAWHRRRIAGHLLGA